VQGVNIGYRDTAKRQNAVVVANAPAPDSNLSNIPGASLFRIPIGKQANCLLVGKQANCLLVGKQANCLLVCQQAIVCLFADWQIVSSMSGVHFVQTKGDVPSAFGP
jgi:hypothetical protein